jgi:hypothetical protein
MHVRAGPVHARKALAGGPADEEVYFAGPRDALAAFRQHRAFLAPLVRLDRPLENVHAALRNVAANVWRPAVLTHRSG